MTTIDDELERDRLNFFEQLLDVFYQAEKAVGGIDGFYNIAGYPVRLRFAGEAFIPFLTPGLVHLKAEPQTGVQLTVFLWDKLSTKVRLPLLIDSFLMSIKIGWSNVIDTRGELIGFNSDRWRMTFVPGSKILTLFDRQRNLAIYYREDTSDIPYNERSAPLRSLFYWWLADRDRQLVHAAAVGKASGGVLLAGKGGSGKSTSALACLHSELNFLSDDYCVISTNKKPHAYSLYNTAKLEGEADLQRFPHLVDRVSNRESLSFEKAILFIDNPIVQFPIEAILVPKVSGNKDTILYPIAPGRALFALAPTTLFQLPRSGNKALQIMSSLVRQRPCYTLEVGTDLQQIPEVIDRLLDRL